MTQALKRGEVNAHVTRNRTTGTWYLSSLKLVMSPIPATINELTHLTHGPPLFNPLTAHLTHIPPAKLSLRGLSANRDHFSKWSGLFTIPAFMAFKAFPSLLQAPFPAELGDLRRRGQKGHRICLQHPSEPSATSAHVRLRASARAIYHLSAQQADVTRRSPFAELVLVCSFRQAANTASPGEALKYTSPIILYFGYCNK